METTSNHLIHESSPYLLQHAHNPVNWYPWGDEALQKAKDENKPILVSIGYSACHWCHVMERESFENTATAAIMNDYFINIKIDREERPDLDQIYMDAVQAIAGNGGWPLNVFLTPEGKPFYGGTYFPPQKAFNRSSWTDVLQSVHKLFTEQREEVEAKANELTNFIGRGIPYSKNDNKTEQENDKLLADTELEKIFHNIMKQADKVWGGFGNAPKFPQTFTINTLLRYHYYTHDEDALKQACLSLDKMIDGGIYDQIGGGFSRYSTDAEWLAPHFEKMLYDNALIISSLSEAFKITKNERYREVVSQTVDFLVRELKNNDGGYYAALDADSEGVEGKFYVWDIEEINNLLGSDAVIFNSYFDISENGNWEGKNILRILKQKQEIYSQFNLSKDDLKFLLIRSSEILFNHREKRVRPATDDKVILGWNALLITALCKASAAFSNQYYLDLAKENYDFLLNNLSVEKSGPAMHHNYKNGLSKNPAFLDDYAFLINACIHLQEATSDSSYLLQAKSFTQYVIDNFSSEDLFYYTGIDQKDIIIRKKEIYDGALPSGNAVMHFNLLYLSILFDVPEWKETVIKNILRYKNVIITYPTSFGVWNALLITLSKGIKEVAITGPQFDGYRDKILEPFIPDLLLQATNDTGNNNFPLIMNRIRKDDKTLIYFCKDYKCNEPTSDIEFTYNTLLK